MPATWADRALRGVLWDLDGTLLDTVGDISLALNRSLADLALPGVPTEAVRSMIGRGSPILIQRALELNKVTVHEAARAALFDRFLVHYQRLQDEDESTARAYPGAARALERLRELGLKMACVTNKQHSLAVCSLEHAGLARYLDLVVGGDTCERRKPAPDPLWHACRELGVPVDQTLMVGDSNNDVLAARAAPMPVVCVPYGYNEGHDPRTLRCDGRVETLADLPALLGLGPDEATTDSGNA